MANSALLVVGPVVINNNMIWWWCMIMLIMMSNLGHGESPEKYWKKVLPNSSIPKTIRESLVYRPEWVEDMMSATSVSVGHGGVGVSVHGGTGIKGKGKGRRPDDGTSVGVGKGGVSVHTRSKKHPVYVGVHQGPNPFQYEYGATEDQVKDDPRVALFFQHKDLHVGSKFNNIVQFQSRKEVVPMLPRKEEEEASIPFTSDKFPEILEMFSISPDSEEAKVMKQTIKECAQADKSSTCTTSLESMVDLAVQNLGTKARAVTTEIINIRPSSSSPSPSPSGGRGNYSVVASKELLSKKKNMAIIACHKLSYPYAVFYCHKATKTAVYRVTLMLNNNNNNNNNDNSSLVKAVAVCHKDTSSWNPNHIAFKLLNISPGTHSPVCHFLPDDHILWLPADQLAP